MLIQSLHEEMRVHFKNKIEDSKLFSEEQEHTATSILANECGMFALPFQGLETAFKQQRYFKESFQLIVSINLFYDPNT